MKEIKIINEAVCMEFSIDENDINGTLRSENIRLARFAQILMLYKYCTKNFNELSVMINRNSHSRVIERLNKAQFRYDKDKIFKRRVDRIENNLGI